MKDIPKARNVRFYGETAVRWNCTCGASLNTLARRVDVHCSCGRIWRRKDYVVSLVVAISEPLQTERPQSSDDLFKSEL